MPPARVAVLTSLAMLAFAANSLLCREALASGQVGPASFTLVRVISGAVVLAVLVLAGRGWSRPGGSWLSAAALFGYAAAFSLAYVSLSAASGALLLFAAVQATMVVYGLWSGERLNLQQLVGLLAAAGGLVWLMLPGVSSPPLSGALLMLGAGVCWGIYSLLGRSATAPLFETAGNFIRAVPFALLLFLVIGRAEAMSLPGLLYAVASGALASGLGYAMWYAVLPALPATTAATVQLSVPIIAALGGVVLLGESISLRLGLATIAVLGGIALFMGKGRAARSRL